MEINVKKIREKSVLQHDSTDCGAACLVSVIRFFGGNSTIEKIRKLSGTNQCGTTLLGLYQAACQSGIDATGFEASVNEIIDYENVLILHVTNDEGLEHYIVCFGYEKGCFAIWDPSKGLVLLLKDQLESKWKSRKCLGLAPNSEFKLETNNRKERRKWIIEAINPEKEILIVSIGLGILISGLSLVMAVFTQKLIDEIIPSERRSTLYIASVLVFILISSRLVLSAIRQFFLLTQGKLFNIRIVDDFYRSLLSLPISFFDTRKTGDFVARLNDTMRIQRVIADIAGIYIIDILVLVSSIIMIFFYSKISGLLSIVCLPVLYLIVYRWNKTVISAQHSLMAGYAFNESNFIDSLRGITEIKSMNWQDFYSGKNKTVYTEFQSRAFLLGRIKVKLGLITGLAGTLYLIIVLLYSSSRVMSSKMTQGELMAIISLSSALIPSVLNLALINIPISEAKVALNRMFEFTQVKPEGIEKDFTGNNVDFRQIDLKNISFRFPGRRLLLHDINMVVEKGKVVSLVGESGCGKSTLANIILRFHEPESGSITINNKVDARDTNLRTWRSKIAIIPQEIHIFNGTILENLLSEVSESKIRELDASVSAYGLSNFIGSFPSGLMTLAGEEGINLSGGQKQLLAFIRVLINKPDILIIDEGTSNMDRGTESMIMNLIMKLKNDMGILLISHRINMVKNLSDYIYVIENRSIANAGTHTELVRTDNLYKRFWDDFV
jgi:ATP-binding cassette, subfamily C, bacteriocin exporter